MVAQLTRAGHSLCISLFCITKCEIVHVCNTLLPYQIVYKDDPSGASFDRIGKVNNFILIIIIRTFHTCLYKKNQDLVFMHKASAAR